MGLKNFGNQVREYDRKTFNVPAVSGDYASEVIEFGKVATGVRQGSFIGVGALIEGAVPSGARVELWLPKAAGVEAHASFDEGDFFYAGQVLLAVGSSAGTGETTSYGSATWALAGVSGARIRVKSAGSGGSCSVSGWAI